MGSQPLFGSAGPFPELGAKFDRGRLHRRAKRSDRNGLDRPSNPVYRVRDQPSGRLLRVLCKLEIENVFSTRGILVAIGESDDIVLRRMKALAERVAWDAGSDWSAVSARMASLPRTGSLLGMGRLLGPPGSR